MHPQRHSKPPTLLVLGALAVACSLPANDKQSCRDQDDCVDGFVCSAGVCQPQQQQPNCVGDCRPVPVGTCRDIFAYTEGTDNAAISITASAELRTTGGMQGTGELAFSGGHMHVSNPRSVHGLTNIVASAWIKLRAYQQGQRILGQYGKVAADDERGAYALFFGSGAVPAIHDSLRFRVSTGPNHFTSVSGGRVPLDRWTHVLGRYTGSALELYIDGRLVGTEPLSGPLYDSRDGQPLGLGATIAPDGTLEAPLDGLLDEVFVGTSANDRHCMATCRDVFAYGEGSDTDTIVVFSPAVIRSEGGKQGTGHLYSTDQGYMKITDAKRVDGLSGLVVSAWVKPEVHVNWARVLGRYSFFADGPLGSYLLAMGPGDGVNHDRPSFHVATGAGGFTTIRGGRVPLGRWTHLLGRYTGSALELYVDGELVASQPRSGAVYGQDALPLGLFAGIDPDGTPDRDNHFRGQLDEVFVGTNADDYRSCLPTDGL